MNGVYIPGMKITEHCMDCPFMVSRDNDDCILQSDEANETFQSWDDMQKGCPLIAVPEHGRLIDADALDDICRIINEREYETGAYITRGDYKIIDRVLFEFPTIIPADKDGEI